MEFSANLPATCHLSYLLYHLRVRQRPLGQTLFDHHQHLIHLHI